jgi:holin-like protein
MVRPIALAVLLLVIGDTVADVVKVPVPGAALGMLLMTLILFGQGGPDKQTSELFDLAAPHFTMFFVPAAVGVVASFDALLENWVYFLTAIVAGTSATLIVTGWLAQRILSALS